MNESPTITYPNSVVPSIIDLRFDSYILMVKNCGANLNDIASLKLI